MSPEEVIQMINDIKDTGLTLSEICLKIGYKHRGNLSEILSLHRTMSDARISSLVTLHEKIINPKSVKENENRWDMLEKELDKKLMK